MSEIKVNKISPRTACGTTTLGDSGDTFTIPAGVTITNSGTAAGFGATGAVSWDTTAKTGDFTAVSGIGYFVNTTSIAISVTLPLSPAAGAVIGVSDYAGTAGSNNITLLRNGSKISGEEVDSIIKTTGVAVTLVYVDATRGWLVTDSGNQSDTPTEAYITASVSGAGNTLTTAPDCGNYKVATFTGPGDFTVCTVGNSCGSNSVDYIVVAGGGGGGGYARGGGGGSGGFREGYNPGSYTASPLATTALPVSATAYPIVIGGGGAAGANNGSPAQIGVCGSTSSFSTIISAGGGGGGSQLQPGGVASPGSAGGSGGGSGGAGCSQPAVVGGAGNTPPVSPSQGFPGGTGGPGSGGFAGGGGGGGASVAGITAAPPAGGTGGNGVSTSITGSSVARGGGGGGGQYGINPLPEVAGGTGGGGFGGGYNGTYLDSGAGTVNTGGGGGGSSNYPTSNGGSAGGSGIVIIRYKFQN